MNLPGLRAEDLSAIDHVYVLMQVSMAGVEELWGVFADPESAMEAVARKGWDSPAVITRVTVGEIDGGTQIAEHRLVQEGDKWVQKWVSPE